VKGLKDVELRMAVEIALEIAKGRGRPFDARAAALKLCRAALADPPYRARTSLRLTKRIPMDTTIGRFSILWVISEPTAGTTIRPSPAALVAQR